jgi:hypothetical protein
MVVGAALDGEGRPVSCEMWPGDKADAKALVGNRGYRRHLGVEKGSVTIDRAKVKDEARYDGKFVLRTNVKQDLAALSEVEVFEGEDRYWLRTEFGGCASKVFRALGIAAAPTVRRA